MADNTKQFRIITTIVGNLEILYEEEPMVLVVGDLLWYPIQGDRSTRTAPDAMVVFGRPKGDRTSYLQCQEEGIAPHVVFEILSPGNRRGEMEEKFAFYEEHGVEEYYLYDPDRGKLRGWLQQQGLLRRPSATPRPPASGAPQSGACNLSLPCLVSNERRAPR